MNKWASSRENFEAWFGVPLRRLMRDRSAGLAVAMVAFPLLERYVSQKARSKPNKAPFNQELLKVIPELETLKAANLFWAIYRHGLLHDVTLSRSTHWLSHDKPIIEVRTDGKVWLNPKLFAKRVLEVIRADFSTFEKGKPLPQAMPVTEQAPGGVSFISYLGTGRPPGSGR